MPFNTALPIDLVFLFLFSPSAFRTGRHGDHEERREGASCGIGAETAASRPWRTRTVGSIPEMNQSFEILKDSNDYLPLESECGS